MTQPRLMKPLIVLMFLMVVILVHSCSDPESDTVYLINMDTDRTITVGSTLNLVVRQYPAHAKHRDLEWSSSDQSVAVVTEYGMITGLAEGTSIVEARNKRSGVRASCEITVEVNHSPINQVWLHGFIRALAVGESQVMGFSIEPPGLANPSLLWSSSNTAVARLSIDGSITGIQPGVTQIRLQLEGLSAFDTRAVKIGFFQEPGNNVFLFAGSQGGAGALDGYGLDALLRSPHSICATSDHYFISDASGIRSIRKSDNRVTTILQNQQGQHINSVCADNDLVYFGTNGTQISRFDPYTAEVSILAGHYGEDEFRDGIGVDARIRFLEDMVVLGGYIYFIDGASIRRLDLSTHEVLTVAGSASTPGNQNGTGLNARFSYYSESLCTDGSNLYVWDSGNESVRKVSRPGYVVTTVPLSTPIYSGYGGGIGYHDGSIYLAVDKIVYRIDSVSGDRELIAGLPETDDGQEYSLARVGKRILGLLIEDGCAYMVDYEAHILTSLDLGTGSQSLVAGKPNIAGMRDGSSSQALFNAPQGICSDGQYAYVADTNNNCIRRISLETGEVDTILAEVELQGSNAVVYEYLALPRHLCTSGDYLFIACAYTPRLIAYNLSTKELFSLVLSDSISALATDGRFVYLGLSGGSIERLELGKSGLQRVFAAYSNSICIDGDFLYAVQDNRILRICLRSGTSSIWAGDRFSSGSTDGYRGFARFSGNMQLAYGGDYLYVTDPGNNSIRRVSTIDGDVKTIAGTGWKGSINGGGQSAEFSHPLGIVALASGLLITDKENNSIRHME